MCKKKQFKYCPSEIDECIKNLIRILNEKGIRTKSSCCGHNIYPMTIIVWDLKVYREILSNIVIPRKRNFYKKDKEGYYYIPEVILADEANRCVVCDKKIRHNNPMQSRCNKCDKEDF